MTNLATTAAGVVAGSFLYQGIQNLMGHYSPAAGPSDSNHLNTPLATSDAPAADEIAHAIDEDVNTGAAESDGSGPDLV